MTGIAGSTAYGWTYDANGNMLTRKENNVTYTRTWDEENRLKTVTGNGQTTTYYYVRTDSASKTFFRHITPYTVGV